VLAYRLKEVHMTKLDLTVVVNGQPTTISAEPDAQLGSIIGKALEQTGNVGQPPQNWELRDSNGSVLDPARKIETFGFVSGVAIFLNLKAGIGG
jgi:hypothetical protein